MMRTLFLFLAVATAWAQGPVQGSVDEFLREWDATHYGAFRIEVQIIGPDALREELERALLPRLRSLVDVELVQVRPMLRLHIAILGTPGGAACAVTEMHKFGTFGERETLNDFKGFGPSLTSEDDPHYDLAWTIAFNLDHFVLEPLRVARRKAVSAPPKHAAPPKRKKADGKTVVL